MERAPLISVIIPTYNRAHLIGETIESVRAQTFDNWELIVIDDGSTDNTATLVKAFVDERIRYIYVNHCGLIGKVRNIGLRLATGAFIAFLDSDDLWEPWKLDRQLDLFSEYQGAGFIFSHGKQFGPGAVSPPKLEKFFFGKIFHPHLLEERFVLYPSTFIFRRDVLNGMEWFDETFSAGESDFFLRMSLKNDGIFVDEKSVRMRKHSTNISREREFIFSMDYIRMVDKFVENGYLTKEQYTALASRLHYKQGLLYLKRGKAPESLKSFLKYYYLQPFHYKGWLRLTQAWLLSMTSRQLPV
jgi:glycosyltransferase involved in cell wall biosynthesis